MKHPVLLSVDGNLAATLKRELDLRGVPLTKALSMQDALRRLEEDFTPVLLFDATPENINKTFHVTQLYEGRVRTIGVVPYASQMTRRMIHDLKTMQMDAVYVPDGKENPAMLRRLLDYAQRGPVGEEEQAQRGWQLSLFVVGELPSALEGTRRKER